MKFKIALADDHHLVRGGIKMQLESFTEFKVIIEAKNGKDLINQLQEAETLPHLILMDVSMPIMNGFDATTYINQFFPDIKVVALSVHDDIITINKMIESGANAYLLKDSTPMLVKNTLLEVMARGFYYDRFVIDSIMKAKEINNSSDNSISESEKTIRLLTDREIEFTQNCCSELTYKEIASKMNVNYRTVDGYRESVFNKLSIKSRTGLVLFAVHHGLVEA
ncbi:DNA-binding response regulator [Bacteroidota bacterium]|nr:DNA-binding response regulator [Bacteroidota bacterium]